jgi:hypothetical protein
MPVTIEQNEAIKRAIRNDLRYIVPGVPTRWTLKRGAWRPVSYFSGELLEDDDGGSSITPPTSVVVKVPALQSESINIATAATHTIIPGAPGRRIKIFQIFFTVGGEVNITLYNGAEAMTGAMDFGGVGEPRAAVIPNDGRPLNLDEGQDFRILLSAAVQVSGLVNYRYK